MDSEETSREHLMSMLKGFDVGILTTQTGEGEIRGRPMALAQVTEGGTVYLATSITSPKVAEIADNPAVAVMLQDSKRWVSLSGHARVVRDRILIDKLWSEGWKIWFPKGKSDPDLILIAVDVNEGEYWDNSGMRGIRFAIEAAKAYLKGTKVDSHKLDEHAKVNP
jgi:general stress protein 26